MYSGKSEACDKAIGEFFYGLNVGASKVSHPLFKDLVEALKTAPASYQPSTRQRMLGDLLEKTTDTLKAEERPSAARCSSSVEASYLMDGMT